MHTNTRRVIHTPLIVIHIVQVHVRHTTIVRFQEPLLALRLVLLRCLGCSHALASAMVNKAWCARTAGQLSNAVEAMLGARTLLHQEGAGALGDVALQASWAMEDARLLWDQVC